jgi:hypothetical protein
MKDDDLPNSNEYTVHHWECTTCTFFNTSKPLEFTCQKCDTACKIPAQPSASHSSFSPSEDNDRKLPAQPSASHSSFLPSEDDDRKYEHAVGGNGDKNKKVRTVSFSSTCYVLSFNVHLLYSIAFVKQRPAKMKVLPRFNKTQ